MALQSCPSRAMWPAILAGPANDCWFAHLDGCPACQAVLDDLTGGDPAWRAIAAELRRPAAPLPPVYWQTLAQFTQRTDHPASDVSVSSHDPGSPIMTARIHVERMPHRNSLAVPGDSAVSYVLLKLIPTGLGGAVKPAGLNLALALDLSGSMYEEDGTGMSRLQRVQNAASAALEKLGPQDTLAIVGFAHNARLLLPPTLVAERSKIEDVLRRVDMFDVDPGGTAMDAGMALALEAVEKHAAPGKLSQVVVLTDGETSGEQNCRELARQSAAKKIRLTLMGVGLDWKASLIKDLARLGQGQWLYIDTSQAEDAARIFSQEFESIAATAFLDVQLRIRPMKDVHIKRLRQVVPEIRDLAFDETSGGMVAKLGALQRDVSSRYILDVVLPRRPDGKYALALLEVSYDPGTGRRDSAGESPLDITYTAAGNGHVNAEVMKYIDDIQLKEMSDILQDKLQANDAQGARQIAQEMTKKGNLMGPRALKKTMLAQSIVDELNHQGRVSKKTQLALDDQARIPQVPE